ncbi:MAG: hypothetical protein HF314_16005 [Ignavibacteria bacterium]|jgi:hypothetical protein|nr:hypothetical protein [Ignavibacteria bacterium]MCU7504585.1 hypothetical protein [Ignavibacteria bacterium]MCU7516577.1 hypothetical protein [Ignavibacteria bacterium]
MNRTHTLSAAIFILLISLTGCIEPVYFQKSETPSNLEGFLGIKWGTPLSILDDHMLETFDVIPNSRYDDYYSLTYNNYYFMDKKTSLVKFIFSNYGFKQVNLFFRPDSEDVYPELDYFLEQLSLVYGSPLEMTRHAEKPEYTGYIEGYYWFSGGLTITLMPGDFIIIRAYGLPQRPPDEPIPRTIQVYDHVEAPPESDIP